MDGMGKAGTGGDEVWQSTELISLQNSRENALSLPHPPNVAPP